MEEQLNFVLKLSLQEIALRRVIVLLSNDFHILDSMVKLPSTPGKHLEEWLNTFQSKITDNMSKLDLPETLVKNMLYAVKPIGLQILRWKKFHEKYLNYSREEIGVSILANLCWTAVGTVEYRNTAEKLVRCELLGIVDRYKLACLYCLDKYIPLFWKELPEQDRFYFYLDEDPPEMNESRKMGFSDLFKRKNNPDYELRKTCGRIWLGRIDVPCRMLIEEADLEFCWPYILKGEESKLDVMPGGREGPTRFHQYAFEYSVRKGNRAATEYFFQKLTDRDREAALIQAVEALVAAQSLAVPARSRDSELRGRPDVFLRENVPNVLCHLLSLMNREEKIRIFKEHPCEVLRCFLVWPWQDVFLDVADFIWTFLPESKYYDLLRMIYMNIRDSGYYFPNIFQRFFVRSPVNFRIFFVEEECRLGNFFIEFFRRRDTDTIKVIFRNIDAGDRARIVSSRHGVELIYFKLRDWHITEVFLREATLSMEGKERLKDSLKEFHRRTPMWSKRVWERFFQFVDETDTAQSKRNSEDGTMVKVKKLRSSEESL